MAFQNDYHCMLDVLANKRHRRLPIYEHIISPSIMVCILDVRFAELWNGFPSDQVEYFSQYCRFIQEMS
jgi:uroporphyrinogen decarboxylase